MHSSEKPISQTISFLIAQVGTAHSSRAGQLLSELGIYLGQEMVLRCLWEDDKLTQSQLANQVGVQLQTINKMVRRMEKNDLVIKTADDQDRRASRIHLTDKGRALQAEIEAAWERLEQETLADFTVEEMYILRRLLSKLRDNLRKQQ